MIKWWILIAINLWYCSATRKVIGPVRDGPQVFVCLEPRGQFRNPDDCRTFYNCWDGNWYLQNCPTGLVFNEASRECDWPGSVPDCPGGGYHEPTIPPTERNLNLPILTVKYTILDKIHKRVNSSITLNSAYNSSVYELMKKAQEKNSIFQFKADSYPWGHYIHTLSGISASDTDHHYWFLYRAKPIGNQPVPATKGPDEVFPEDNEEILFIYEKW